MRLIKSHGQSVTEYAIVFSVVAAAILGMQIFVRRGLQAKEKAVVDHFTSVTGSAIGAGGGTIATISQYEPYYASSAYGVTQGSTTNDTVAAGGVVTRTVTNDSTTRTGSATTGTDLNADNTWQ